MMLMDRYSLLQKIGIYTAIARFLTFNLLPFAQMFRTSLSAMRNLFHQPYDLWGDKVLFKACSDMWTKVPRPLALRSRLTAAFG